MNRAVFLDRDGVINRRAPEGAYITRWEDMYFLPDVVQAIALLNRSDFRVIVASNQRCVAKGLITAADLELIHQRMCDTMTRSGAIIDAVYYCPHEKLPACNCRKPAPGLLLNAAREHGIDLTASWMVGDSEIDVEAGRRAGCKTARLLDAGETAGGATDVIATSLLDAIQQILSDRHQSTTAKGA